MATRKTPALKTAAKSAAAAPAPVASKSAAAKDAKPGKAAAAAQVAQAARSAKGPKATKETMATKATKTTKATKATKVSKAPKVRRKPVRDSFTMPESDFSLIATLKARALAAQRETKKSELLRAGLHALAALDTPALVAMLGRLEPVKIGRPKRAASHG